MERYKNIDGDSGVVAYEIEPDSITVQFSSGAIYLYTCQSAGDATIAQMKQLAVSGECLNSFIKRVANKSYERRLR